MGVQKIGIVTNHKIGIGIAKRFQKSGRDTFVCISNDKPEISDSLKHVLSEMCDNEELPFGFDTKFFNGMAADAETLVLFINVNGFYSESFIESFVNILPSKTIFADCCKYNFVQAAEKGRYFSNKNINYISLPFICSDSVSEIGPAFFPCGDKAVYDLIKDDLESTAAAYEHKACCYYLDSFETGSFIRSLNEIIFRSMIDVLSDGVTVLNKLLGYDYGEIYDLFLRWNDTLLKSNATTLVADIISRTERDGENHLIDSVDTKKVSDILPSVMMVGFQSEYYPNLFSGLNNCHSVKMNELSAEIDNINKVPEINYNKKAILTDCLFRSCHLSFVCIYVQALELLENYVERLNISLDFSETAKAFFAGCMIKSSVLLDIIGRFDEGMLPSQLLTNIVFKRTVVNNLPDLRKILCFAMENGTLLPGLYSTLSYFNSFCSENISDGMIQLCNDCIFDTGYGRKGQDKLFYADWGSISRETESCERQFEEKI